MMQGRAKMIAFLALAQLGCADGKVFKTTDSEKKPTSADAIGKPLVSSADGPATPVTVSRYKVEVNGTKVNVCQGNMTLTIWSDFQLTPEGTITCIQLGTKDVKTMFPPQQGGVNDLAEMKVLPEFGKVMRKPNSPPGPGVGVFTPPRPFIIGPVIQRPEDFNNYSYSEDSQIDYTGVDGRPIHDTGKFWIHVMEAGVNFQPDGFPQNFSSVIHYAVETSGFQTVPRAPLMLHKSVEYWFNTRPLAIPKIIIHTSLDVVNPGPIGNIGAKIFGDLEIILTMIDFRQL